MIVYIAYWRSTVPNKVEAIKQSSRHLRGNLFEDIYESPRSPVSPESMQLLKFHGLYQQDDRDVRRSRRASGQEPLYSFMIRIAVPAGRMTAEQYLAVDRQAEALGVDSLRLTSRQAIQLHGLAKQALPDLIRKLTTVELSSLAGCGDVVRNMMCCPEPKSHGQTSEVIAQAQAVAALLKPRTTAYRELWVDGTKAWDDGPEEPLYGETYLPRKFKCGFAFEGDNCIDVYSHDIGMVAHTDSLGRPSEYTVLVGGGLGRSHGLESTRAILAKPLGTIPGGELVDLITAIISIQRDYGNRDDRKFGRMKYLVEAWGLDQFRHMVEDRLGRRIPPPRPLSWNPPDDHLGWHEINQDEAYLGLPVANGRINNAGHGLRQSLRRVIEQFQPEIRITPQQNLILAHLHPSQKESIYVALKDLAIPVVEDLPLTIRHGMACPALPTCGLALAESERVFPTLLKQIEKEWQVYGGLSDLHVRMTGCPNNCARSFLSEIGIVGCSPGHYNIYLGGSQDGTRLNQLFRSRVPYDDIVQTLIPVFKLYHEAHRAGESFGDFALRLDLATHDTVEEVGIRGKKP